MGLKDLLDKMSHSDECFNVITLLVFHCARFRVLVSCDQSVTLGIAVLIADQLKTWQEQYIWEWGRMSKSWQGEMMDQNL